MNKKDTERLGQFADHLKHLRNEKGLSIRELAARCNVDFSKIGKIEKKKANLTLTTLIELAEGLDMHPKDLLNIDFDQVTSK